MEITFKKFKKLTEVIGETFSFVVLAILIATLIIFVPWLTIWAINTLVKEGGITGFHIPLNFWTWLAAFIIIRGVSLQFK
jgi:hypothetical protein